MKMKKVLWLEDQYEDLIDFSSRFGRNSYLVDPVESVTEFLEKLKTGKYDGFIFDLKVLPGDDPEWQELDEKLRAKNPHFDPNLGFELLRFLNREKEKQTELWQQINIDFSKVIIFSVVNEKTVYDELESYGIPANQFVYKSDSNLDTLPNLITKIQGEGESDEKK